MLTSIQGIYRDGKIELAERPSHVPNDTGVIVTFLEPKSIDLREREIDEMQAADLRAQLAMFAEDWDRSEMNLYDDYDAAKANL